MDISCIESEFCPSFHPLSVILNQNRWDDKRIRDLRVSAFPKFLKTFEEVQEYVDKADNSQILLYRSRFAGLLESLGMKTTMFKKLKYGDSIDELQLEDCLEDAISLSEESKIDILIPRLSLVLIGHDDFGFIVLFDNIQSDLSFLEKEVTHHGLFMVSYE